MQTAEISIIFPVKNISKEIPGIFRFIQRETAGISVELIVLDMGSSDQTVLQSVLMLKNLGIHGYVVQNGDTEVPSALNTGIQKAGGEYLTFLFARRLYMGFLPGFLETARKSSADFLFGCTGRVELRAAEKKPISSAVRRPCGKDILKEYLQGSRKIDIAGILLNRQFLKEQQIGFEDDCAYGYAEEFLCRCLLAAKSVIQAAVLMQRETDIELKRGSQRLAGKDIFQQVGALVRIADAMKFSRNTELLHLLEKHRIPLAVMDCIDVMLREGNSRSAVRTFLHTSGYSRFLTAANTPDWNLRRRIALWLAAPWFYRTEKKT